MMLGIVISIPFVLSYDPGDGTNAPSLPADAANWVVGALHVHSSYSDGAGTVDDIADAASNAGLDFVVITDHLGFGALEDGAEGYFNGVLRLVGVEATTDSGHVVGLDLPVTPLRFGQADAEEVLSQIQQMGGFALAAHPDADQGSMPWSGWNLRDYEGLELFSAYTAYRRQGLLQSLSYLFISPFWQTAWFNWDPAWNPDLLSRWDRMLPTRKLVAWAGSDAHGGIEITEGRFVPVPSYEEVFRVARNHLLLREPLTGIVATDRQLVFDALREGRGYISLNDRDDKGFRFWAEANGGQWPMGSDIALEKTTLPIVFRVDTGVPNAEVQLLKDGVPEAQSRNGNLTFKANDPGIYRAEARRWAHRVGGREYEPWILSNPISVLNGATIRSRITNDFAPRVTLDASVPKEYPITFKAEPNEGCASMELVSDQDEARSFRMRFKLNVPPKGARDSFFEPYGRCAMANRLRHDFSKDSGVRFEVRGDSIYRVTFLIADIARRSGDPSFSTVSFVTGRDWREVTVPFSRLFGSRWRGPELDTSAVSEVSFFIDTSNTRPGTSGLLEIRGFSVIPTTEAASR